MSSRFRRPSALVPTRFPFRPSHVLRGFVAVTAMAALSACASGGNGGMEMEGTIQHIEAPASIGANEELMIVVHGVAGPNLCYGLARIDRKRTEGRVTLTAIASSAEREGTMCAQALAEFEQEVRIAPPFRSGTFELAVEQDGAVRVMETVQVR